MIIEQNRERKRGWYATLLATLLLLPTVALASGTVPHRWAAIRTPDQYEIEAQQLLRSTIALSRSVSKNRVASDEWVARDIRARFQRLSSTTDSFLSHRAELRRELLLIDEHLHEVESALGQPSRVVHSDAVVIGAQIGGTVTDATGTLLQGVPVRLTQNGSYISESKTDAFGHYGFVVGAGTYHLVTQPFPHVLAAQADVTAVWESPTNHDFVLQPSGEISGTVTVRTNGQPIYSLVEIFDAEGTMVAAVGTDSLGLWSVNSGLVSGTYYAMQPGSGNTVGQLYADIDCVTPCNPTNGTPIAVSPGAPATGIDFHIAPFGTASGVVRESISGVSLRAAVVVSDGQNAWTTYTDADGSFSAQMANGTYRAYAYSDTHTSQLWDHVDCPNNTCTIGNGTPFAVNAPAATPISFDLASVTPAIYGTISDSSTGSPIQSATVQLFDNVGMLVEQVSSDRDGKFALTGDLAGRYYVSALATDYFGQMYNGIECTGPCDPRSGAPIDLVGSSIVHNVDFNLRPYDQIVGHVTNSNGEPLSGYAVVYDLGGQAVASSSSFLGDGSFAIRVPDGSYYVRALSERHVSEVFDDQPCLPDCSFANATALSVSSASPEAQADFVLSEMPEISGAVTSNATGGPINATVKIFDANHQPVWGVNTDPSGQFTAFLVPGTYFVTAERSGYQEEIFDDVKCTAGVCDFTQATPLTIATGQNATANFALDPTGGIIRGDIRDRETSSGLAGIVSIYDTTGSLVSQVMADASGVWSTDANPLAPGTYYAVAESHFQHASQVFSGIDCLDPCSALSGTPITATAGGVTPVSFSLSPMAAYDALPTTGSTSGGERVVIEGFGFTPTTTVSFGGVVAQIMDVNSTTLVVATPAHPEGVVDVTVTRSVTDSWTIPNGYTFMTNPPVLPRLVRDLAPGPNRAVASLAAVGDVLVFSATDAFHGAEVWFTSDGSSSQILKDIEPGESDSWAGNFTRFGAYVYFTARQSGVVGLWRTDGSAAGTTKVADIGANWLPDRIIAEGEKLYISGRTESQQEIIWSSDGTSAGTQWVGTLDEIDSVGPYVQISGTEFFYANGDNSGGLTRGFWRIDADGPHLAIDVRAGGVNGAIALNDRLLFVANSFRSGQSGLYGSDGTEAGTALLKYFPHSSGELLPFNGKGYFLAGASNGVELWQTDGSSAGTVRFFDFGGRTDSPSVQDLVVTPGSIYFSVSSATGPELWKTDGSTFILVRKFVSASGIRLVSSRGSNFDFVVENPSATLELWESDGTESGTHVVGPLDITSPLFRLVGFAETSGRLFFSASGGTWSTDGSDLVRLESPTLNSYWSSRPTSLSRFQHEIYFSASLDGTSDEYLWKSDGTAQGTDVVYPGVKILSSVVVANDKGVFFVGNDGSHGNELWVSDGSLGGTHIIADLSPGSASTDFGSKPTLFTSAGRLFFMKDPTTNKELWITDGTAGGTHFVASGVLGAADAAGNFYYSILNIPYWEVWRIGRGETTPRKVDAWIHDFGTAPSGMFGVGDRCYYGAGSELRWSDGRGFGVINTGGAVYPLADLNGRLIFFDSGDVFVTDGYSVQFLATVNVDTNAVPVQSGVTNGRLFFRGVNESGAALWVTDGTLAGTSLVYPTNTITAIGAADGKAFFSSADGLRGNQLWVSDGTTADGGTYLLADLSRTSSDPNGFEVDDGQLYFAATTETYGRELYALPLGVPPTLSSITPASGSSAGGYTLTATGANFASGMRLTIGGVPVSNPTSPDGTTLAGTVNPLPPGLLLDVAVEEGDPVVLPNAFFSDFLDVPASDPFHSYVEKIVRKGITVGCGNGDYCPSSSVSRLQMAIFLARAIAGGDAAVPSSGSVNGVPYECSSGGTSLFSDIAPDSPFCRHVHYIASHNVTRGCSANEYCPSAPVTRLQMAGFLARAVAGSDDAVPSAYTDPTTGRSYDLGTGDVHFTDIALTDFFDKHANYIWARGITDGCGATTYCPASNVIRLQMAKFLATTFP